MESLEEILRSVLERETPTAEERRRLRELGGRLEGRLREACENLGLRADVELQGSVAKDTWIRSRIDLDVFLLVHADYGPEVFKTLCLEAARRALAGSRLSERYASHPYLEAYVEGVRVNVVPCYRVERGGWRSATDRTPHHTRYVKARLTDEEQKSQVRLLKRFLLGVGVYGAEIKTGGFSGYLAELLTLHYGGFVETLRAACRWRPGEVVDVERHYGGEVEAARALFDELLIVVDPVDRRRNAASAVRPESLDTFRAAASRFLKAPSLSFFYPPQREAPSPALLEKISNRGTDLVFLVLRCPQVPPDVLWGQVYRSQRSLASRLEREGFNVLRLGAWSDERAEVVMVFELESARLRPTRRHRGPEILSPSEGRFLSKHLESPRLVSGPWIEGGRWHVLLRRRHTDARAFLQSALRRAEANLGLASHLAEVVRRGRFEVLLNEEIGEKAATEAEFRDFLREFLAGRPAWLGEASA